MNKIQTIHAEHHKHHPILIFFIFFVIVIILLLLFAFYKPSITGNVIKGFSSDTEKDLEISSKITPPDQISVNSDIEKIQLRTNSPANLYLENKKIELTGSRDKASIIINDYQGELSFDKENVLELDGKASKIFVDGIPITPTTKMNIRVKDSFRYSYLKLNSFHLDSLSYVTSGIININQEKLTVRLENETLNIEGFEGDLEISRNELKLQGLAQQSNIPGLAEIG
jgi:hypothetical protein